MVSSCRNMWRQRSFWARGWPAILQTHTVDTHSGHTQHRADQRLVMLCCGTVWQTWMSYVLHTQPSRGPGEHTDLLMNCSRPARRSSMKESSKRPSSLRNGSCLFRALPGRDGTTIWGIEGHIYEEDWKHWRYVWWTLGHLENLLGASSLLGVIHFSIYWYLCNVCIFIIDLFFTLTINVHILYIYTVQQPHGLFLESLKRLTNSIG